MHGAPGEWSPALRTRITLRMPSWASISSNAAVDLVER